MSAAFDALALDYDHSFTATPIGMLMRRVVWRRCAARFAPGARVLELNCGTGEDAVHLAQSGVRVLATDASQAMLEMAALKAARAGVSDRVSTVRLDLRSLQSLEVHGFDGLLSNFGGLNCLEHLQQLRRPLAARLRPGAAALLCVMGPCVPWEWCWFMLRGRPDKAFRRLRRGGVLWRGQRIRYPTIGTLRRALAPDFQVTRVTAIGALLPPPYAAACWQRWPNLLARLDRWERRCETLPPLPWLADHYLLELRRV
jgi:SAM-dependent methyltransferase